MNKILITYSNNNIPFIVKTHNGLVINSYYCSKISYIFLTTILHEIGFDNVPDNILEQITQYPSQNEYKDATVVFSYT